MPALAGMMLAAGSVGAGAMPGESIGEATAIENLVTAAYARDTRSLQAGDGVRQDERINVGLDARSEFTLNDDTRLALGPGSELVLDKFVYDPDKAKGTIAIDIVKGTLRWVTGAAKKPAYTIRVPNASITVRGTTFDLFVNDKEETWVLLHEGAVQVCNSRGQCRVHEESCKIVRVSEGGDVGGPQRWRNVPGAEDKMFHRAFPFVVLPPEFDPNPGCSRQDVIGQRDAGAPPADTPSDAPPAKVRKASVERSYEPTAAVDKPVRRKEPVTRTIVRETRYEEPAKPVYVKKPKREVKYEAPRVKYVPQPRVKYVPQQRIRYASRDRDDDDDDDYKKYKKRDRSDDDDDRPKRRGGRSGVGKAILGAAVVGAAAALAIGFSRRGGGGYGY